MRLLALLVLLGCLAQLPGGDSGPFHSCFGPNKKSIVEKQAKQEYSSGLEPLVSAAQEAHKHLMMPRRDCTDDELLKKLRVFKELADYDKLKKGPEFNLPNPKSPVSNQFGMPFAELLDYTDVSALDCSHVAKLEPLILENHRAMSPALLRFLKRTTEELSALCGEEALSDDITDRKSRRQLLLGLMRAQSATDKTRPSEAPVAAAFQRLPTSLEPEHYDLLIWPRIREPLFVFDGSVAIRLRCRSATRNITLHAHHIAIDTNTIELFELDHDDNNAISGPSGDTIQLSTPATPASSKEKGEAPEEHVKPRRQLKVKRLSEDPRQQFSIVNLNEYLEPGRGYLLRLSFVGLLNEEPVGFYKMKYQHHGSSETSWIAATHFQATGARRAFPCFDEPNHKATFSISIKHSSSMSALANMPIERSEKTPDGLWITDTFVKTPPMSTYLLAWTVTDFESHSEGKISVWVRRGTAQAARYAIQIADETLRYYEHIFGTPYPLPKLDMIALPKLKRPAMGNWGLITFREEAMLYHESKSTLATKQLVTGLVARELAHQWFGNLVTMKWWDEFWLNEGFAHYMEYIGVDHVEPKWRMSEQVVLRELHRPFKRDSLNSARQISVPVHNPDQIDQNIDSISYAKGASIVRMMSYFLGEDLLMLGLQRYLKAFMYKNAEQSDFWALLTEAQRMIEAEVFDEGEGVKPVDVERVMNSWTLKPGYPLVTLIRNYDRATPAVGRLEQSPDLSYTTQPFVPSPESWDIPITFTWESEQDWHPITRLWMRQNEWLKQLELSGSLVPPKANEWMLVNVQQVGYYRVNYDERNWRLLFLQLQLDHTQIPPINRAQLLDDVFELAKDRELDYGLAMEATKYLKREHDYLPWKTVLSSFGNMDQLLQGTMIYGTWQDYVASLIEPFYERYMDSDWTQGSSGVVSDVARASPNGERRQAPDSNDLLELYNLEIAVTWACKLNIPHCVQQAKRAFAQWRASGENRIKPELRLAVYCTAIKHGDLKDWRFLLHEYKSEQDAEERAQMGRGLACTKDRHSLIILLRKVFDKTLGPTSGADGPFVFEEVAKSSGGREVAFNYMVDHWGTIKEFYREDPSMLNRIIDSVASSMNTCAEQNQLSSFYEFVRDDLDPGKRFFGSTFEIQTRLVWRIHLNFGGFETWLLQQRLQPRALDG